MAYENLVSLEEAIQLAFCINSPTDQLAKRIKSSVHKHVSAHMSESFKRAQTDGERDLLLDLYISIFGLESESSVPHAELGATNG